MAETHPSVQGVQDLPDLKKDCASISDVAAEALGIFRLGQISLALIKKLKKGAKIKNRSNKYIDLLCTMN